jgi:hypothetical protein
MGSLLWIAMGLAIALVNIYRDNMLQEASVKVEEFSF